MRIQRLVASLLGSWVIWSCSSSDIPAAPDTPGVQRQAVVGNIHPFAIQIDGPAASPPGADLFPDGGTSLNSGATQDWVLDSLANSGTNCLASDSTTSCIQANVTGATGGVGHWNGVRIVDGIAGADQDIFTRGGKENDPSTWDINSGTVGSSKYDLVQAYLANNQTRLFFGMERAGNNGTTAFDFEFNQLAPRALASCPQLDNVPCRTNGDVLFTFEMQGSGGSGSATPFVFTWNGSAFVSASAAGILSSINNSTTTKGGPWGHVDSHGNWVLGNLDRFIFAEASAPLSLLPGIDACGGTAYVQVRTRSSSTDTSDLKDTSKVFEFNFLGLTGTASLSPSCNPGFNYNASALDQNGQAIADAGCAWTFSNGATSTTCSGFLAVSPGTYTGEVTISDPSNAGCDVDVTSGQVAAYGVLLVTPVLVATCNSTFTYSASVDGGVSPGTAPVSWTFDGGGTVSPATSTSRTGTVTVGTGNVGYSGTVQVSETRGALTCTANGTATVRPLAPLRIDLNLQTSVLQCPTLSSDVATYAASYSGGNGSYTLGWIGQSCSGNSCTIDPADATFCSVQTVAASLSDTSNLCPPVTSETENYSKVTTLNASDNP